MTMDCICTLEYEPVCVGSLVFSNACFAACADQNVTGWFNNNGEKCSDYRSVGDSCGGFVPPEFETRCDPTIQCVNTGGQFIVDNPGKCLESCVNGTFDHYGKCIPDTCTTWNDGCNNCVVGKNRRLTCTEKYCNTTPPGNATCMDESICDDIECPVCNYGNETQNGECCGCKDVPDVCCLAMTPSCLACGSGQTVAEWCVSNPTSEWYGDCGDRVGQTITMDNLKTICTKNPNTENCNGVTVDDSTTTSYIPIVIICVVLFTGIPIAFFFSSK